MGRISIRERLGHDIHESLAAIRESVGYNYSYRTVQRFRTTPPDAAFLPGITFYMATDGPAPEGRSTPYEYRFAHVTVEGWVPRPQREDEIDSVGNLVFDDLYRAMIESPQRHGWAIDTVYDTMGILLEQYAVGVQCTFLVKYRFLFQDPTQPVRPGT